MTLFKRWVDFVVYPLEPERVHSREQRLMTQNVPDVFNRERYRAGEAGVLTRKAVLLEGEEFEVMEIDDYGYVTIWTNETVYKLNRDRGMEKMIALPRHPPTVAD